MPEYRELPIADVYRPERPWRRHTLMARMEEFMADIAKNGQLEPIGVVEKSPNYFEVVYGDRRSIAITKLGWTTIKCMVYQPGESDLHAMMASENLQRNATNDMEDAVQIRGLIDDEGFTPEGITARFGIPASRVRNLLLVLAGDERCHDHIAEGTMSIAQAMEVNKFESAGYKTLAIKYAVENDMSAMRLELWRKDIQRQGMEIGIDDAIAAGQTPAMVEVTEPHILCTLLNHSVKLVGSKTVTICPDCWNTYVAGREALGREAALREAQLWLPYLELLRASVGGQDGG
jgi:ParB/RepB/Spo0J family partition protein